MSEKRLFLLDALALIYRSYHHAVVKNSSNSSEIEKATIYGFFEMLCNILQTQKPSHIAVVFDVKKSTFRHALYPKYKANRKSMPPAIASAIAIIKDVLHIICIRSIELAGFEADDIIGSLAKSASKERFKVYMVTPDKDFYQLVDENIVIYKLKKTGKDARIIEVTEVCNMYSVANASQLIDLFAFTGDKTDNIPPVLGFGKRSVKKLLSEYGSIEVMFSNLDKMPVKQSEMLIKQKEAIMLSKKLVSIDTNVLLGIPPDSLELNVPEIIQIESELDRMNMSYLYALFCNV